MDFLLDSRFCAEFYLTQVVSHLDLAPVKRFLAEVERRPVPMPGMFCVFYYRSANPKTLAILSRSCPCRSKDWSRNSRSGCHRCGRLRSNDSSACARIGVQAFLHLQSADAGFLEHAFGDPRESRLLATETSRVCELLTSSVDRHRRESFRP